MVDLCWAGTVLRGALDGGAWRFHPVVGRIGFAAFQLALFDDLSPSIARI